MPLRPDCAGDPDPAPETAAARPPTVVAMSGGVDSSTVAALLVAAGEPVVGMTMQLWNQRRLAGRPGLPERTSGRCCSLEDVHDARRVAEHLAIPYYVVNHEEAFERDVVRDFAAQYRAGRTPLPCARCNTHVKFATFLETARQIGAARVATGHYARVAQAADGTFQLRRARDEAKDQTYFLWGLNQEQLRHSAFPLGEMTKPEVRVAAARLGLRVAEKAESYEICFVPGNDYAAFLDAYSADQRLPAPAAGELVTTTGRVLGRHAGVHHFTVGQRRGLGVATGDPLYVLRVLPDTGQVVVGGEEELYHSSLLATGVNWISGAPPAEALAAGVRVSARIRHRHPPAPARARLEAAAEGGSQLRVIFDAPQRAIAPGQAVVLYQEDLVLGGAWIEAAEG